MMPEAQRIAIAEAVGWKGMDFATNNVTDPKGHKHFFNSWLKSWEDFVPDYLQDLNAMHEAEESEIEPWDMERYSCELFVILDRDYSAIGKRTKQFTQDGWRYAFTHATAAQRAEAFLRVKGLWK